MSKFKSGDVVVLKSGGPKMTVAQYETEKEISCIWFNGNEKEGGLFLEDQLELDE